MSIMVMCILDLVYTTNRDLPYALTIPKAPVFAPFYGVARRFRLEEEGASEGVGGAGGPAFLRRPYPI